MKLPDTNQSILFDGFWWGDSFIEQMNNIRIIKYRPATGSVGIILNTIFMCPYSNIQSRANLRAEL